MTSEAGNDVMKSPPEKSARGFFVRSGIREKAHGQKTGVPVFLPSREDAVPERFVMRHASEERMEKPRHGCLRRARVSARDAARAFLKERRLFCPAGRKKGSNCGGNVLQQGLLSSLWPGPFGEKRAFRLVCAAPEPFRSVLSPQHDERSGSFPVPDFFRQGPVPEPGIARNVLSCSSA